MVFYWFEKIMRRIYAIDFERIVDHVRRENSNELMFLTFLKYYELVEFQFFLDRQCRYATLTKLKLFLAPYTYSPVCIALFCIL